METEVRLKAKAAKSTAAKLRMLGTAVKNEALKAIAEGLDNNRELIKVENKKDIENAKVSGMSVAMIDRLKLDDNRIDGMIEGIGEVVALPDPVGEIIDAWKLPNELSFQKVRVPLGLIGMIFESRPNVTIDAAILCLKSGNPVVLRGGEEANHSNQILGKIIRAGIARAGMPEDAVQVIETLDREAVGEMLTMNEYFDVIIPRGGHNLINRVVREATVPVIKTGVGNCHMFVDESADFANAVDIIENAKVQRPGVCNAIETVLVHENIAEKFLPILYDRLNADDVEIRGCEKTRAILPEVTAAVEEDWATEFLALILSVKVVGSVEEAIEHIALFGTKHSEAILTNNYENSFKFVNNVDAAAVYVNASTRFTDGQQFGLGAEIGISTQNLHVRGPMGLRELTTNKYIVFGHGQVRK